MPAYLIADADALDPRWFEGVESVGITAGASAPAELVQQLIDRLRELAEVELSTLPGIAENVALPHAARACRYDRLIPISREPREDRPWPFH